MVKEKFEPAILINVALNGVPTVPADSVPLPLIRASLAVTSIAKAVLTLFGIRLMVPPVVKVG